MFLCRLVCLVCCVVPENRIIRERSKQKQERKIKGGGWKGGREKGNEPLKGYGGGEGEEDGGRGLKVLGRGRIRAKIRQRNTGGNRKGDGKCIGWRTGEGRKLKKPEQGKKEKKWGKGRGEREEE